MLSACNAFVHETHWVAAGLCPLIGHLHRLACASFALRAEGKWLRLHAGMLERLAAAAAGFLEEGSPDARAAGRRLIWRLAAAAGGAEGLARLLARAPGGAERRRLALETLETLNLTPEGLLQAMPAGASAPYGPDGSFLGQAPGTPDADSPQARGTPGRGRRRSAGPAPAQPAQGGGLNPLEPSAYPGMQAEAQLRPGRLHADLAGPASAAAFEGSVAAAEQPPPALALQGYAAAYAARRPRRLSRDC